MPSGALAQIYRNPPFTHLIILTHISCICSYLSALNRFRHFTWNEAIQPSEQPYQVGTIIVSITIFLYVRKQAHRGELLAWGLTASGWQKWDGPSWSRCLSTETDRQTSEEGTASQSNHIYKITISYPTRSHIQGNPENRTGGKHTATPPAAPPGRTFPAVLVD